MANVKISELAVNSSPSASATLAGVDGGETVQIPISKFVTKDEGGNVTVAGNMTVSEDITVDGGITTNSGDITSNGAVNIKSGNALYMHSDDNTEEVEMYCDDDGKLCLNGKPVATLDDIPSGGGNTTIGDTLRGIKEIEFDNQSGNIRVDEDGLEVMSQYELRLNGSLGIEVESTGHIGIISSTEGISINSKNTTIDGVSSIKTINEGIGQAGQVLTTNGETVYWGNASGGGSPMTSITYAELRALRDAGNLIPGMFYRITDYECTTAQENTRAMNHRFYIIVQALSHDTLSETAKADLVTDGTDDYFVDEGANVSAWEIKYCLDNDTTRFAWADEENGKGVIYYMKDEHGNECPYDFKNIQFKRMVSLEDGYPTLDEENGEETWVYTFCGNSYHIDNDEWSELKDGSLENPYGHQSDEGTSTFHNNVIGEYRILYDGENEDYTKCGKLHLSNNVFFGYWEEIGSTDPENYPYYYAHGCMNNKLGNNCYNNTFDYGCDNNTFSYGCYNNTFGYGCHSNTFGKGCYYNTFWVYCRLNTFDENCSDNTFGDGCEGNTFGYGCYNNTFDYFCSDNTFGVWCYSNTFGNGCSYNTLGDTSGHNTFDESCRNNTIGNDCTNNTFGNDCTNNTFGNVCWGNTFGEGCNNNYFALQCRNSEINGSGNFVAYSLNGDTINKSDSFITSV